MNMDSSNHSLAYRRTDKAIINAFISLVTTHPFEKITVQDIMDEALVSRYTFYHHFHDKYEIAEQLQEQYFKEFVHFFEDELDQIPKEAIPDEQYQKQYQNLILAHVDRTHQMTSVMNNIHTETVDFAARIQSYFQAHYRKLAESGSKSTAALDLEASLYGSLVLNIMDYYGNRSKLDGSEEPISRTLSDAYMNVLLYAVGIHDTEKKKKCIAFLRSQQ